MINILHMASFIGNIGDNASHIGFNTILENHFPKFNKTNLEIRKFYQNYVGSDKQTFNDDFIDYINTFDLFVIGGGGFLDYWVPNSASGTTIDITPSLLKKIKTPTIITSIGCHPHKEVPTGNIEKFRNFLDASLENKAITIALRNDGSIFNLKTEIGSKYFEQIPEILDHGFFYQSSIEKDYLQIHDPYVAINITSDQLQMKSSRRESLDTEVYLEQIQHIVSYIINELNLKVVFVPHIISDISAIHLVIQSLQDLKTRSSVFVAPLLQGDSGTHILFSVYRDSAMVLGSRFHANVCSLAMQKKVIGLSVLDRVQYVFESFNLKNMCIDINQEMFSNFKIASNHSLAQHEVSYLKDLSFQKEKTLNFYKSYFNNL